MALNIPGVIVMVFFYLLVLGTGVWASFKSKKEQKKSGADKVEMALLGNRSINWVVGMFTMTASWVGGAFIVGMTETVYTPSKGLILAVIILSSSSLSFVVGGLVFAKPMRDRKYVTMIDPFQIKYGKVPAAPLSLASVFMDVIWVTGTLTGLADMERVDVGTTQAPFPPRGNEGQFRAGA